MNRPYQPCKHCGCPELTRNQNGYCDTHVQNAIDRDRASDRRRGTAQERGYTYRWAKYSKWFLRQPGNQICKLHIDDGCTIVAQCVDHIQPHKGQSDPLFWDNGNHQPACIHCNSVKGNRYIKGTYDMIVEIEKGLNE